MYLLALKVEINLYAFFSQVCGLGGTVESSDRFAMLILLINGDKRGLIGCLITGYEVGFMNEIINYIFILLNCCYCMSARNLDILKILTRARAAASSQIHRIFLILCLVIPHR